jgi:glycosyltransferase involved in cell wall biosynthesis
MGSSIHNRRAGASERPSVLFVLPGIGAGGSEHVVNMVANHWNDHGWRVAVATFAEEATPSYYSYRRDVALDRLGFPPAQVGRLSGLRASVRRVLALRRAMRRHQPALVISFLTRTNIVAVIAGLGLGIPLVVSERNNPALQPIGPVWRMLRSIFYPLAFGLITMTAGARDYFPARLRRRSWVIPNAAELPAAAEPRRSGRTLTAVGRLVPQKGFDLLLEAFAEIAPRHPDWLLLIWGEGPDRQALEAQRDRLGLADRVLMPGISKSPGSWIETADIFVLSSRYEGWGIVLLEAMAAGLPAVSFDCEFGPREMIRDGVDGLIAPAENVPALAATLDRLMADAPLRARLGAAARQSSERFTTARVLAQWDEVAQTALDKNLSSALPGRGWGGSRAQRSSPTAGKAPAPASSRPVRSPTPCPSLEREG